MSLTIPYTINNGDALDATKVMGNFTAVASFVNSDVMLANGSVVMTGQLTLVGDPVNANHAARKAYVDAQFASVAIPDGSISGVKLQDGAVSAVKLSQVGGSQAVSTATIQDAAVTEPKLAASAVTEAKLAANAVTSAKINAGAVVAGKLGAAAVATSNIADAAVDHVKRKRGDRLNRQAASAQAANNNVTTTLLFGAGSELDTFTGGVSVSSGNHTLPAGYTGDYSVLVRLTSLTGTWNTGKVKIIINNGDRAYRYVASDVDGQAISGVFQLTAGTPFYVEMFNDNTGGQISCVARLEVRQLS